MSIVETKKLMRRFGNFTAVSPLDIAVESGDVFALLGPNGAGKSTVIKMLTTLLPATSGDAFINGCSIISNPTGVRKNIGYVPQLLSVDGTLTGYENLLLFARLYDIPYKQCKARVMESLELMGLEEAAKKAVHTFSGGMVRRLEIAQSMLHRPAVLFLDEPTVGLDPIACKTVWEHMLKLKTLYNTTIIMTTHSMAEADYLCNTIAFMSQGELVISGTPQNLKDSLQKKGTTLEDAFIHYTSEPLSKENNYTKDSTERDDIKTKE